MLDVEGCLSELREKAGDSYVLEAELDLVVCVGRDAAAMVNHVMAFVPFEQEHAEGRITWKAWRQGGYGEWRSIALRRLHDVRGHS